MQSYEQAAADPPPPFWETTIMAPGLGSDEVFIDGLPVGTFFAFVFNAMGRFPLLPGSRVARLGFLCRDYLDFS